MRRMSGSRRASCLLVSPIAATGASSLTVDPTRRSSPPLLNPRRGGRFRSFALPGQRRAPQLAAGGVDVGPLALADMGADARPAQGGEEVVQRPRRQAPVGQPL